MGTGIIIGIGGLEVERGPQVAHIFMGREKKTKIGMAWHISLANVE